MKKFARTLIQGLRFTLLLWGIALILSAVVPLLPLNWWWIRLGDFPRVQLLIGYVVCGLALTPFWKHRLCKVVVLGLVVSCGIQLVWIYPYLPFASLEVEPARLDDPDRRIRLMAANVLQSNHDSAGAFLDVVADADPDVLVLCEVNKKWLSKLTALDHKYEHRVKRPLDNGYGLAFYSRLELEETQVRHLVKETIPSVDTKVVLPSGHRVRVFAVHPNPPRPGEGTDKRDAELVLVGREVREDASAIVLGDMNDTGWSRTTNLFQEVSRLLDPRKGRGFYVTYDAHSTIWRYPLDHAFHSDDFRLVRFETLPPAGSDHRPILVELSHEPGASPDQEAPDFSRDDAQDAEEAVDKADQR